ncbi:MAG: DUF3784 domain-containing protein [Symbiobacteriia bacterium]
MIGFAVVTALVGVTFFFLGYVIKFHGMVEMLAGYDPSKVIDKKGLANWVGGNFFLLGVVSFLTAGVGIIARGLLNVTLLVLVDVAVLLVLISRTAFGTRRYEKGARNS